MKDAVLAQRATQGAVAAGLETIQVRCGDAADPGLYRNWLPVNVLLLCGIFGNVSEEGITTTISAIPNLVASEGMVIWTRGRSEPDLRPRIRSWFARHVLLALLAERVRALSGRLLEALYVPADVRVVRRLLEALELHAGSGGDGVVPAQEDLAGLAGTTCETVNRVLRVEEQRGSLSLDRGRVRVVDALALSRCAR